MEKEPEEKGKKIEVNLGAVNFDIVEDYGILEDLLRNHYFPELEEKIKKDITDGNKDGYYIRKAGNHIEIGLATVEFHQ